MLSKNIRRLKYADLYICLLFYVSVNLGLPLKREHRLRLLEKWVQRNTFGTNREEVRGDWGKMPNEEYYL